jgi:hypothetical protein
MSAVRGSCVIQGKMNFSEIKLMTEQGAAVRLKKPLSPILILHAIYYVQADLTVTEIWQDFS